MSEEKVVDSSDVMEDIIVDGVEQTNLGDIGLTLAEQILTSLLNDTDSISLKMSRDNIRLVRELNKIMPTFVKSIVDDILTIIGDNVLDVKDVPPLINICKNVINANYKELKKIKVTRKEIIDFSGELIHAIISHDSIKIKDKTQVLAMLASCIALLEATIDVSETIRVSCFGCC
jgi:hypothetical protein